jgi:endonuclease G
MLVSVNQLKKASNLGAEEKQPPNHKALKRVAANMQIEAMTLQDEITATEGNILSETDNREKRKEMIAAKGLEPVDFAYERAIGKNDSLYSNFTELVALTKRKVGRIVLKENNKTLGYATGFMVSDSMMLTNWHVFEQEETALGSEVHFFYEYDAYGHPQSPVIFRFDTHNKFFNNESLDYCLLGVQPFDISGKVSLASIGWLFLDEGLGKIGSVDEEWLNIIHHPLGDFKQISIRENKFVDISDTKIYYETDTAQGSSGSPVFNDQWQVVGLHHKSVAKMTPDEQHYLDKDGHIIPETDGKIDIAKVVWLKNEGIRISVILHHLSATHGDNTLLAALSVAPPLEHLSFVVETQTDSNEINPHSPMPSNPENNIIISVPVSALRGENSIDIHLSGNQNNTAYTTPEQPLAGRLTGELLLEVAKVDKEQGVDFSKCKGYDPGFLGTAIALPQPKKALEKHIALLKDKSRELKYFNYSVIFNAVKKMPLISAINVEGDSDKRKDNSKRKDDWLRDKRIDEGCQLTDKFYAASGFDKGHMSRWEDADWANTEADAKRNGIYTCFYTNACPQVVDLNRAGGFWGKLEKAVLEKGIKKEQGKLARMTVFNGPIFDDKIDRIRQGVIVPMQFFKIILWIGDDKKLKATGFKLTQELLVKDDQFDELFNMAEEALDIDKAIAFKQFRISIKKLSQLTQIDFSHIEKYDTFKSKNNGDEAFIISEEKLVI